MENEKLSGLPAVRRFIVLVVQGAIIGAGAILPGISGGVLCVAFGIYQPMMAILAKPIKNIPRYWHMFIPILIGWIAGFVGLAKVISDLLEVNSAVVTSLFIGLIAGTFPSLFKEGAKNGRTRSAGLAFGAMAARMVVTRSAADTPVVTPSRASMETVNGVP